MEETEERQGRDLEQDIAINKYDLPGEWEKHPQIYMYWAEEHAYATMQRDQEKDQLDLIAADMDSSVRAKPEDFGIIGKPTETAIAGAVKRSQQYGDAVQALHKANLIVNRMAAAKSAVDHKRKALEGLTQLAINEFYNSNTIPPESAVSRAKKNQNDFAKETTKRRTL